MAVLDKVLLDAQQYLNRKGISEAKLDAWYLAEECFRITRMEYLLNPKREVSEKEYNRYMDFIKKRGEHIPYQYIIQSQEFMGLPFYVNENVLIPRQDTEVLVEHAMKYANNARVLDVCTGSGCIAISIAKLCKVKSMTAVDISDKALTVAEKNAKDLGVDVTFIESDLYHAVQGTFDMIVSNPPYIPTKVVDGLMPEVKDHEPRLALDGEEDGLVFYHRLAEESLPFLVKGGRILMEIGCEQGESVSKIFCSKSYQEVKVIKDLSGLDRVVVARRA